MKPYWLAALVLTLTACSTPKTVMHNASTNTTIECGGHAEASVLFGAIGYAIQAEADKQCVEDAKTQGFKG